MKYFLFLPFIFILFITGCSTKEEVVLKKDVPKKTSSNRMEPVSFSQIEGFFQDDLEHALEVFKKDCKKSKKYETFREVCRKAEFESDGKKFFIVNFQPYKLYDSYSNDEGIITGYYEPLLYGSLKQTSKYKYPVYKMPKDLVISKDSNLEGYKSRGKYKDGKLVPYDTREEIENNPNNPNYQPIAYVDDKVDLFFLQVQGSGKIKLDDGRIINIGYSEQNGRKYFGVGKYLLDKGYITKEEMSAQSMKSFFDENPSMVDEILNQNESYIFFKISNKDAIGSLGSILTAKRNLAVDRTYIPLGTPVFLNTRNPVTKEPINQLMVAADVGGAIKGEIRADFFWGFGDEAFQYAGRMKEKGKMYVFLPK